MTLKRREACTAGDIPDADGPVMAARGQKRSIWTEAYPVDVTGMTRQDCNRLGGSHVPEIDAVIVGTGSRESPRRIESHIADRVLRSVQGQDELAGRSIDDARPSPPATVGNRCRTWIEADAEETFCCSITSYYGVLGDVPQADVV